MNKIILFLSKIFNYRKARKMNKVGKNVFINAHLKTFNASSIQLGSNLHIGKNCTLMCYKVQDKIGKIVLDDDSCIGDCFRVETGGDVVIGKHNLIASNVSIYSHNHGTNPIKACGFGGQPLSGKDVCIKEECWIGEKVIILPGVTIGEHSIIGAGSIVTKSIPSYSIAVGNPAKIIKKWDFENNEWKRNKD